jgi:hypothetical protein
VCQPKPGLQTGAQHLNPQTASRDCQPVLPVNALATPSFGPFWQLRSWRGRAHSQVSTVAFCCAMRNRNRSASCGVSVFRLVLKPLGSS